jgi:hypothetical protein
MPEDDRDRYCCSGCPALGGPSGIGGSFYCESGDDQVDLETRDGRPLRSAKCIANNQPLLTREEFLAAVRKLSEDDELTIPESALVDIERIQWHHAPQLRRMFVRLRDSFASIRLLPAPSAPGIAFVGEAVWGSGAMRLAKCEIAAYRRNIESLEHMLAGLGEAEPAQTG